MAGARQRGETEALASGSLRAKIYAGVDPLSGKRVYLTATVPAGLLAEAKKIRTRLIGQVDIHASHAPDSTQR